MNILVLAPHVDDESLGCGGTIAKLAEDGNDVFVYAFAVGASNIKEFTTACKHLGATPHLYNNFLTRHFNEDRQAILQFMVSIAAIVKPHVVFVPAASDCHQDHQVIHNEALRAFKYCTIYGYEQYWNSYNFKNHCYSILSDDNIEMKLQALRDYETQQGRKYFSRDVVVSLARMRGMQVNTNYAECFEVIRQVI